MSVGTRSTERPGRILTTRWWMLLLAVACQLATIGITWKTWTVRDQPMNLPLLPLPAVSFLIPMLVTATAVLAWPRVGIVLHAAVYLVAVLLDQYRLQPQFFSLIVLMFACGFHLGPWVARWYLATMWIWTGTHKLLSSEWLGVESWSFFNSCGANVDGSTSFYLAIMIGAAEIALGLLAVLRPKLAAPLCVAIHSGILLSLSPLMANHNQSVWPWNLATMVIGAWLLLHPIQVPHTRFRFAFAAVLLIVPAGFYLDAVNSRLAFVLYSGNLPRGLHVRHDGFERISGWTGLEVPLPASPRILVQVFDRQAEPGEKLHVADPRPGLPDRYFLKQADGTTGEITRGRFYGGARQPGEVAGRELDGRNAIWQLTMAGVDLTVDAEEFVDAATIEGDRVDDRLFGHVRRLPNLRLLKFANSAVTDEGLRSIADLSRLEVIEIEGGQFTRQCLSVFQQLRALRELRLGGIELTNHGLEALRDLQLHTLHLHCDKIDDRGLFHLGTLHQLSWLDLSNTNVTGAGLASLHSLQALDWLSLSGTPFDDVGLEQLARLRGLEIVELTRTNISDVGLNHLRGLVRCQVLDLSHTNISDEGLSPLADMSRLETLKLRGTRVTAAGVQRLRTELTGCRIDW